MCETKQERSISRRELLKVGAAGATGLISGCQLTEGKEKLGRRQLDHYNLLYINVDQMRSDALSCVGNPFVSTPNLDRLASEGVRFTHAVTPHPMCVAARTSIHTGLSIHTTGCVSNELHDKSLNFGNGTFDQVLKKRGYQPEYWGRYHQPVALTDCYQNEVTLDFIGPYRKHLRERFGEPSVPKSDEFVNYLSGWPYQPDPIDYELRKSLGNLPGHNCPGVEYGKDMLPSEHTYTAFVADQTIAALCRLSETPFAMTAAILAPHHPQYVASPYYNSLDPCRMPKPVTMQHRRENTTEWIEKSSWQLDSMEMENVGIMQARYYELIQEIDFHVGRILKSLDEQGLAENTLVIFTSDHGEMLGDHGLQQKFVHYQESIRVPLFIRLPGKIRPGTVVNRMVNTLDMFPTIFDYLGQPCPAQEGMSLRPLIEGKPCHYPDYTFSEMSSYTLFVSHEWKYVWTPDSSMDMLYNMIEDPRELNNLLGKNPDRARYVAQAQVVRKEMRDWMERIHHKLLPQFEKSDVR